MEVVIELADPSRAGVIIPVEQEENEDSADAADADDAK